MSSNVTASRPVYPYPAVARYNGSVGRTWYSDMVIQRWTRWNGADDLGLAGQPVKKPTGG